MTTQTHYSTLTTSIAGQEAELNVAVDYLYCPASPAVYDGPMAIAPAEAEGIQIHDVRIEIAPREWSAASWLLTPRQHEALEREILAEMGEA